MAAYYNEFDPYAAQWLRNLITAGHIAPGVVDERSIEDVQPSDLRGFEQCHFFAGIGVWSLALRRAGWPDDRPVWTGSCPCQPFSQAGEGAGFDDERHLWPHFQWLIAERRPPVVFGEQVASRDAGPWIDLVQDDLEGLGYGVGAVAFPSAGIGAPHIRDRLYWMAHAHRSAGRKGRAHVRGRADRGDAQPWPGLGSSGSPHGLADNHQHGRIALSIDRGDDTQHYAQPCGKSGGVEHAGQHDDAGEGAGASPGQPQTYRSADIARGLGLPSGGLGDAGSRAPAGIDRRKSGNGLARPSAARSLADAECGNSAELARERPGPGAPEGTGAPSEPKGCGSLSDPRRPGPVNGLWRDADWLFCRDGKWRPVEPSTFPLAHGAPARVGRLRAHGNAINAQQAQIFIEAAMSSIP